MKTGDLMAEDGFLNIFIVVLTIEACVLICAIALLGDHLKPPLAEIGSELAELRRSIDAFAARAGSDV